MKNRTATLVLILSLPVLILPVPFWQPQPARAEPTRGATENGDVNCDGRVDISDAVSILGWLFLGGEVPCPVQSSCPEPAPELEVAVERTPDGQGLKLSVQCPEQVFAAGYGTSVPDPGAADLVEAPDALAGNLDQGYELMVPLPHPGSQEETILLLAENSGGTATSLVAVSFSANGAVRVAPVSMSVGLGDLWDFIKKAAKKFGVGLKKLWGYVKWLVALKIAFDAGCWIVLIGILIQCGTGQTQAEIDCRCTALKDQPATNYLVWNVKEDAKKMGCEWAKD